MWVSGLGTEVYRLLNNLETDQLPSSDLTNPRDPAAHAGLIAMGVVIAGSIVFVVFLLSKITSWRVAFVAGLLLSIDPFYIAHSQMIHVDAFLAAFMLLSAISWLVYLNRKARVYLILSGIAGGLALLTKSPSYYLIPFVGLTALIQEISEGKRITVESRSFPNLRPRLQRLVIPLVIWFAIAVVIVFALWPSMWEAPALTVSRVFDGVFLSTEQPHEVDQFFAGEIISDDPGFLFYLASLSWHTTVLSLIGSFLAIYFIIRKRDSWKDIRFWLYLLIYIGGFILMMTLAAKKWERYLLPAFVAIDVLAAWGIVQATELLAFKVRWPAVSWRATLFLILALLAQAILVIRHQPYFGTHFNQLLGGTKVAQNILHLGLQGEGMDLAADFLNNLPGVDRLRVATQPGDWLMYQKSFEGLQVGLQDDPQFLLFHINHIQRPELKREYQTIWDKCKQEGPFWSASFDGVPYVWICPTYDRNREDVAIGIERDTNLGEQIDLIGYELSSDTIRAGEALSVTLYWQLDGLVNADNHVFVHLSDESGSIIAQHDGVPALDRRPTWNWLPDEIITDIHPIMIPISAVKGSYTLYIGMYDYDTLERLPSVDENGERYLDDRIELGPIEILSP
jgi:4-amino-4-deoxy-L-arabinose transferase-like glycosyltransferase